MTIKEDSVRIWQAGDSFVIQAPRLLSHVPVNATLCARADQPDQLRVMTPQGAYLFDIDCDGSESLPQTILARIAELRRDTGSKRAKCAWDGAVAHRMLLTSCLIIMVVPFVAAIWGLAYVATSSPAYSVPASAYPASVVMRSSLNANAMRQAALMPYSPKQATQMATPTKPAKTPNRPVNCEDSANMSEQMRAVLCSHPTPSDAVAVRPVQGRDGLPGSFAFELAK